MALDIVPRKRVGTRYSAISEVDRMSIHVIMNNTKELKICIKQ